MHCRPFLKATLRFVDRQRTTAWQSAPMRLVNTPTSAVSKNSTGCRIRVLNSSDLHLPWHAQSINGAQRLTARLAELQIVALPCTFAMGG